MAIIDIFEGLTFSKDSEGVTLMTVAGAFGIPVSCEYWHVGGQGDQWRYRLSGLTGRAIPFPTRPSMGARLQ